MAKPKHKTKPHQSGTDPVAPLDGNHEQQVTPALESIAPDEPIDDSHFGGAKHTPIVSDTEEGSINEIIPFPIVLRHNRSSDFYSSMSSEAYEALLSVIRRTFRVRDVAQKIIDDSIEDPIDADPLYGLALNIINAVDMGFTNLSPHPLATPEEATIANTVLGIAEYAYDLESSSALSELCALRAELLDFTSAYPIDMTVNLSKTDK